MIKSKIYNHYAVKCMTMLCQGLRFNSKYKALLGSLFFVKTLKDFHRRLHVISNHPFSC
jgi:hypothetical protein